MRTTIYALMAMGLSIVSGLAQSGTWVPKAKPISGTWQITEKGGKKMLVLKGFKTSHSPDLKLFLSPRASGKLTGNNATKNSVEIGDLKSFDGDQSYVLPKGVDLSKFRSVVIHCEKYSKLWGVGTL